MGIKIIPEQKIYTCDMCGKEIVGHETENMVQLYCYGKIMPYANLLYCDGCLKKVENVCFSGKK